MRVAFALGVLALLSACASTHAIQPVLASPSIDFSRAETVEVVLANFKFAPAELHLTPGRPYLLKFTNSAGGGHDFTAPDFFAAAQIYPDDAARISDGQVELEGGESSTIRLVPNKGEYKIVCTHFGHSALGMTGKIIVR